MTKTLHHYCQALGAQLSYDGAGSDLDSNLRQLISRLPWHVTIGLYFASFLLNLSSLVYLRKSFGRTSPDELLRIDGSLSRSRLSRLFIGLLRTICLFALFSGEKLA